MDTAQPPQIVVQGAEPCLGVRNVDSLLRRALLDVRAPGPGWRVSLRVERFTANELRAEGDITNGNGMPVARRVLFGTEGGGAPGPARQSAGEGCDALTRAIGVWASLVLDAELPEPPSLPRPSAVSGPVAPLRPGVPTRAEHAPSKFEDAGANRENVLDSSIVEGEYRPLDFERPPQPVSWGPTEVGLGGFIMAGPTSQALVGATPSLSVEWIRGFRIRPSVSAGQATSPRKGSDGETVVLARVDVCARSTGLYAANRGLALDLCGGVDAGALYESLPRGSPRASSLEAYASVGPSLDISGGVGSGLAVVLRGVGGVNIAPAGWSGRFEFALSWGLP